MQEVTSKASTAANVAKDKAAQALSRSPNKKKRQGEAEEKDD
jgi:hypothetical protein